jgi:hypothetical protein
MTLPTDPGMNREMGDDFKKKNQRNSYAESAVLTQTSQALTPHMTPAISSKQEEKPIYTTL